MMSCSFLLLLAHLYDHDTERQQRQFPNVLLGIDIVNSRQWSERVQEGHHDGQITAHDHPTGQVEVILSLAVWSRRLVVEEFV